MKLKRWTQEEINILKEHYGCSTQDIILSLLPNRTWSSILTMGKTLKIKRKHIINKITRTKEVFSKSNQDEILKLAGTISASEIAKKLNLSRCNVYLFLRELGLGNAFNYGVSQSEYKSNLKNLRNLSGIYYIKNITNKKFYIGVSINVGRRISQHLMELSKQKHCNTEMQNDYNSGHKFKFGIITEGPNDVVELTKLEYQLILLNKDNGLCYNKNLAHTEIEINDEQKERFWAKVDKSGNCWNWTSQAPDGYGEFKLNKKTYRASRISYFLHTGENPQALVVCHSCDNPLCVNPNHLFLGSDATNAQDRQSKGKGGRPKKCA